MKKQFSLFLTATLFLSLLSFSQTTKTVGATGADYATLNAAFSAINSGTLSGAITLQLTSSTTETTLVALKASGSGSASYTSVTLYPTSSGLSISCNLNGPLIGLDGADGVVIDGRVNATGTDKDLSLINTNTGNVSVVRFLNSAQNNTVKYCNIKGASANSGGGIIVFSSASTGTGNDNNTIDTNNITSAGPGRVLNGIIFSGSGGRENSGNTISNNAIYDCFNATTNSYAININSGTLNCVISGNSFYETTTITPTTAPVNYYVIRAGTASAHVISNNYIGGSAPLCGGSPLTINANLPHYFCGIYINGNGSGSPAIVQGNHILNMDYTSTNANPWDGIYINAGNVNVVDNTIGAATGTAAIKVTTPAASGRATITAGIVTGITLVNGGSGYTTPPTLTFSTSGSSLSATATATISGGVVTGLTLVSGGLGYTGTPSLLFDSATYSTTHGIRNFSTNTVLISGNTIGAITITGNNGYSHGLECIVLNNQSVAATISNNLIGSLTTANSINVSSAATASQVKQDLYGVYSMATSNTTISGNTIANLYNNYSGSNSGTRTRGIATTYGVNTIENNLIRDIASNSAQVSPGYNATVVGISQLATGSGSTQNINGNTIYNLSASHPSAKVDVYGILNYGPNSGTNFLAKNFIHSLSASSTNTGSSLIGIYLLNGQTTTFNNIINLGQDVSTGYALYGILDNGGSNNNNNIYFNTVYIGGTVSGTTSSTSALWNAATSSTRNYRNNILANARSGGATGKHYAIRLANASLTIDANDYYASGTRGVLGYLSSDKTTLAAWKTATAKDANSFNTSPAFFNAGGILASDYYSAATLQGIAIATITTDFEDVVRGLAPKVGAFERNNYVWVGSSSTNFATAANWSGGAVPPSGADIVFAYTPANNCVLDQNRTLNSIKNAQSTYLFLLNGKQLTLSGDLDFTNGAQLDATAAASQIVFAGTTAQSIPSGAFKDNSVAGLTVNTTAGLTQNGNLTVALLTLTEGTYTLGANSLTFSDSAPVLTNGTLDASNSGATVVFANAAPIVLPAALFTGALNNLTLSGAGGVKAGANLTVNGVLNLNAANPDVTNGLLDLVIAYGDYATNPYGTGDYTNSTASFNNLNSYVLTMGENATTIGIGDVTGKIRRTNAAGLSGNGYTYGNKNTQLTFTNGATASDYPTQITVVATRGAHGTHIDNTGGVAINGFTASRNTVKRMYQVLKTGGVATARITWRMAYEDSQLNGIADETLLVTWDHHIPYTGFTPHEHGKTSGNTTDNYVEISNHSVAYLTNEGAVYNAGNPNATVTKYWMLAKKESLVDYVWLGATNSNWNITSNWGGGKIPYYGADIIIPDAATTANDPVIDNTSGHSLNVVGALNAGVAGVKARSIEIKPGGVLTVAPGATPTLTLYGGPNASGGGINFGTWVNSGTFGPGTSTVLLDYDATASQSTVSGTTQFYNLTVASGKKATFENDAQVSISGVLANSGTLDAASNSATVVYNGSSAQNVAATTYHNLTVANAVGLSLTANTTTNGLLNLAGNTLTTSAHTLTVGLGGTVTRTTGFVKGNLEKILSNGATLYEIGTSVYAPVTLDMSGVSGTVAIAAKAINGTPEAGSGIISSAKSDHYWTLTSTGGGTFTTCKPAFDFAALTNTGTVANYSLAQYQAGSWTLLPNTVSGTVITNTGGVTTFGNFAIGEIGATVWDGTSWSLGTPTALMNAIINAPFATATNGTFTANSLTVTAGNVFTINADTNISVVNTLDNKGDATNVIVESNANLVQMGMANSNSGAITINRATAPLMRLDYVLWTAPVSGQPLLAFSPATMESRFYSYNPLTDIYNVVPTPADTDFEAGKGYLIRMPNTHPSTPTSWNGVFSGLAHNGNLTFGVRSGAYNAIGNPYPSAIDADTFIAENGITEALYFWRKTNGAGTSAYATYTAAGGTGTAHSGDPLGLVPNGVIQVGQGFIVKATSSNLTFTNSMRTADNANLFLRNASSDRSRIWLNLTQPNGTFSQTLLAYMPNASQGIDPAIDGRYINDNPIALTSIIDNAEYSIQGRALPFDTSDVVPLGFKTDVAGTFSLLIDHVDGLFRSGTTVYLKDRLNNTVHNLSAGGYDFATEAGTFNTRFEIVYQNALAVSQPVFNPDAVIVYKQDQELVVNTGKVLMVAVKVFDISGRLLAEKNNINSTATRLFTGSTNEVLLVQIVSENEGIVTKKVIN